MKKLTYIILLLLTANLTIAQEATEIVRRAYLKIQGSSQYAQLTMQIIRPKWTKTFKFKYASKGENKALLLITSPEKEKGQAFLFLDNKIWLYNPKIKTVIKLGAAMMTQKWLSSDASNDLIMNKASMINNYNAKILGNETVNNLNCWKIELTPKKDYEDITWAKQLLWIDKINYLIMKTQFYDEDDQLVSTETAYNIKNFHGKKIPSKYVIQPANKPNQKTILIIDDIIFNVKIPNNFFTIQNLRRGNNINFNF